MKLNVWVAENKRSIFDNLVQGTPPQIGRFDEILFKEVLNLNAPTMGKTVFAPNGVSFEFVYQVQDSSAIIFPVWVESPHRIVYRPVPDWVIENIWQGSIAGSYVFEPEANEAINDFVARLTPNTNQFEFEQKQPVGRQ